MTKPTTTAAALLALLSLCGACGMAGEGGRSLYGVDREGGLNMNASQTHGQGELRDGDADSGGLPDGNGLFAPQN